MNDESVGVLCVDDNEMMAEALKRWLSRDPSFHWLGWLPSADLDRILGLNVLRMLGITQS